MKLTELRQETIDRLIHQFSERAELTGCRISVPASESRRAD